MSAKDRLEMIAEYSHKRFKVLDNSIKTIKREESEKKLELKRMMFLVDQQRKRRVRQSFPLPSSRSPDTQVLVTKIDDDEAQIGDQEVTIQDFKVEVEEK